MCPGSLFEREVSKKKYVYIYRHRAVILVDFAWFSVGWILVVSDPSLLQREKNPTGPNHLFLYRRWSHLPISDWIAIFRKTPYAL